METWQWECHQWEGLRKSKCIPRVNPFQVDEVPGICLFQKMITLDICVERKSDVKSCIEPFLYMDTKVMAQRIAIRKTSQ